MLILAFTTAFLYLLTIWRLWLDTKEGRPHLSTPVASLWGSAVLLHAVLLSNALVQDGGVDLSIFRSFSLSVLLITILLFALCFRQKLSPLGLLVLPFSVLALLLDALFSAGNMVAATNITNPLLQTHIVSSLLAYAFLILATVLAAAAYLQDYRLKKSSSLGLLSSLLPLTALESFLFSLLTVGVLLLSVGLVSGWMHHEDLFAQHLVHKTVLSVTAWIFFMSVLVGKLLFGWRGKTVWKIVLSGAIALILSYFGSKFVLELILS